MRRPGGLLICRWLSPAGGLLFVLFLCAEARAQTAAPADNVKPIFLVADVVVGEGVPIAKDAARDVLATRFGRLKDKLEVRSFAEAKASIDAVAMAQLTGSGDDGDLQRIEDYMQVDRLVIGRVTQIAGTIDLQVKVFNMKEGVTEVAFARRLGKNADRSMILTMLDTLADSLLAWTIDNYTDGSMSTAGTAAKAKKLGGGVKQPVEVASSSPWSMLGVFGGVGVGLGAGMVTLGLNPLMDGEEFQPIDYAFLGVGAAVALTGAIAVSLDVIE